MSSKRASRGGRQENDQMAYLVRYVTYVRFQGPLQGMVDRYIQVVDKMIIPEVLSHGKNKRYYVQIRRDEV